MPRIFDNIEDSLDLALNETLAVSHRFDASIGYFNLRGWSVVAGKIDEMSGEVGSPKARLLVGMTVAADQELRARLAIGSQEPRMDFGRASDIRRKLAIEFREQLTLGIPSARDEATLRQLRRQLIDGDVVVKLYLRHRLHAKLYLCHRNDVNPISGFLGSSNLTMAGLVSQGELNVDVLDHDATRKLHRWFEARWNDDFAIDISRDLIEVIEESWARPDPLSPYLVFLKIAYHLSRDAREGLLEFGLPESMSAELLEYQSSAVRIAARILEHRGGVLIGDVVGLGKTMVATAIARLLQDEQGMEALIVCPKNLQSMWEGYVHKYRLLARVQSLSMVTRDLPDLRRYRLVIVDESHNLRNRRRKDYIELRDYIDRNDSKVVLLTATPYNKRYDDVADQIGLFLDDDQDLGIRPERAIAEVGELDFSEKCDGKLSSLVAFRRSDYPEDWQRLMSLFLVRRTRRFIRENYGRVDSDGRSFLEYSGGEPFYFPDRVAQTLSHDISRSDPIRAMLDDRTLDMIDDLNLPRYSLARYVKSSAEPSSEERVVLDNLARASGNLIGITRTMLYKRLSSSGAAFQLSLQRHLLRNWVVKHCISEGLPIPIGHVDEGIWDDDRDSDNQLDAGLEVDLLGRSFQDRASESYSVLRRKDSASISWISPDLFGEQLDKDLDHDIESIESLLSGFGRWDAGSDTKVDALFSLVTELHPEEKILVFTEYRDTADYVAAALRERGVTGVESVSGSTSDPTRSARRFSPISNEPMGGLPPGDQEIRVLVATDVLSEGQNLQDSHIIVNFDLPWAIIKIIQRAGRVDRIGQVAPQVLVYSFMPAEGVEALINLRGRISERLRQNAVVFGSDEEFFGDDGERRLIEGLYDESSRIEEEAYGEADVDWSSVAFEFWRHAIENHPAMAAEVESLPDVVYSTRAGGSTDQDGVLVYVATDLGLDALAFTSADGESRLLTPIEALTMAECAPAEAGLSPLPDHHVLVAQAVTGPMHSRAVYRDGALTGVRKRCWDRLRDYHDANVGTLFATEELMDALDELYSRPLTSGASQTLANALRSRSPDEIAELVVALHRDDRLCVAERDLAADGIRIVCSLGMKAS